MEIAFKISNILIVISYLIASLFLYFFEALGDSRLNILIVFLTIQVIAIGCWLTGYFIRQEVLKELNIKQK